jgi:hypothetical protein
VSKVKKPAQSTIEILTAREAAGTIDTNGRFVLRVLRNRAATGFVQPTGAQIMAVAAQLRDAAA